MKPAHPYYLVGRFFFWKCRMLATARGIPYATKRMARDGVPKELRSVILNPEGYTPPPKPAEPSRPGWMQKLASLFFPIPSQPPERPS